MSVGVSVALLAAAATSWEIDLAHVGVPEGKNSSGMISMDVGVLDWVGRVQLELVPLRSGASRWRWGTGAIKYRATHWHAVLGDVQLRLGPGLVFHRGRSDGSLVAERLSLWGRSRLPRLRGGVVGLELGPVSLVGFVSNADDVSYQLRFAGAGSVSRYSRARPFGGALRFTVSDWRAGVSLVGASLASANVEDAVREDLVIGGVHLVRSFGSWRVGGQGAFTSSGGYAALLFGYAEFGRHEFSARWYDLSRAFSNPFSQVGQGGGGAFGDNQNERGIRLRWERLQAILSWQHQVRIWWHRFRWGQVAGRWVKSARARSHMRYHGSASLRLAREVRLQLGLQATELSVRPGFGVVMGRGYALRIRCGGAVGRLNQRWIASDMRARFPWGFRGSVGGRVTQELSRTRYRAQARIAYHARGIQVSVGGGVRGVAERQRWRGILKFTMSEESMNASHDG